MCPRRGQHFTKQTISHSRDAIPKLVDIARDGASELKVQPERLIQLGDQAGGKAPDNRADAVDWHRSDLFGLGFGIQADTDLIRGEKHLKRKDPRGITGNGDDRDHASPESSGNGVGAVVADDDRRTTLVGLPRPCGLQIDQPDLAAEHYFAPSATVTAQASASPASSHSCQATV